MRKAAGTSLDWFLSENCCRKGMPFVHNEGRYFNPGLLQHQGVFFITVLRHPMERIRSSWKYEGVCPQTKDSCAQEDQRAFKAWSVQEMSRASKDRQKGRNFLWNEFDNYFIRRLVSLVPQDSTSNASRSSQLTKLENFQVNQTHLEQAKEILENFHIVLTTDHLADKEFTSEIEKWLGFRPGLGRKFSWKGKSAEKEQLAKELFDWDWYDHLAELNKFDEQLYEYANGFKIKYLQFLEEERDGPAMVDGSTNFTALCTAALGAARSQSNQTFGEPKKFCKPNGMHFNTRKQGSRVPPQYKTPLFYH